MVSASTTPSGWDESRGDRTCPRRETRPANCSLPAAGYGSCPCPRNTSHLPTSGCWPSGFWARSGSAGAAAGACGRAHTGTACSKWIDAKWLHTDNKAPPTYASIVLDEWFVKPDSDYTGSGAVRAERPGIPAHSRPTSQEDHRFREPCRNSCLHQQCTGQPGQCADLHHDDRGSPRPRERGGRVMRDPASRIPASATTRIGGPGSSIPQPRDSVSRSAHLAQRPLLVRPRRSRDGSRRDGDGQRNTPPPGRSSQDPQLAQEQNRTHSKPAASRSTAPSPPPSSGSTAPPQRQPRPLLTQVDEPPPPSPPPPRLDHLPRLQTVATA